MAAANFLEKSPDRSCRFRDQRDYNATTGRVNATRRANGPLETLGCVAGRRNHVLRKEVVN